jgi:hypothetical protein
MVNKIPTGTSKPELLSPNKYRSKSPTAGEAIKAGHTKWYEKTSPSKNVTPRVNIIPAGTNSPAPLGPFDMYPRKKKKEIAINIIGQVRFISHDNENIPIFPDIVNIPTITSKAPIIYFELFLILNNASVFSILSIP